jgi:DNA-binding transcriptional LysR family regulator
MGIAFLPRMIADQRDHALVRAITLAEPQTDYHIAMVWRRGSYVPHAARAWLQLSKISAV